MTYNINTRFLKSQMVLRGFTSQEIAGLLKIANSSLWRKISGKVEFTANELFTLCDVLRIKDPYELYTTDNPKIMNNSEIVEAVAQGIKEGLLQT